MKHANKFGFTVVAMFLALWGCGGGPAITKATPIQDLNAPCWVIKGSGCYGGERGTAFYGVGSASGIGNMSLLRTASDNRARNDVAKVFEFNTKSLMKDYMASTTAGAAVGDTSARSEEQHVEQVVKTIVAMTLSGVEIVDHWQNPATGELFALARLDLKAFDDSLDKVKELDKGVKEYIKQNADKLHQELDTEVEKKEEKKN
ncbi:MAG: LPP20 family lipoprotein [Thermodesulfobacteriota bacterium]